MNQRRAFITLPLCLPRLSDRAAAQLLDILEQLHGGVRHHYGHQAWRWHTRQQRRTAPPHGASLPLLLDDEPF
ncbi:MAG TPA: hypothetical protein VFH35_12710 [Ramlibacter sp.]|nr:hypothetical protein [Ramlibacter sp.]